MNFTLCIPTIDRYDIFLCKNLPLYIDNPLINEIIITDENGNDIDKILNSNMNKDKLKLYKNKKRLGPFLNKISACKYASNEWIALIDSDNFADLNYFNNASEYIKSLEHTKYDIISPSFAKPRFNYKHLGNKTINKLNLKEIIKIDNTNRGSYTSLEVLMNTGNYILNKNLINDLDLSKEINNLQYSSACDVIYLNTLFFEQFNLNFHIRLNLEYDHVVHGESIYIKTHNNFKQFNNFIYNRFKKLISNRI